MSALTMSSLLRLAAVALLAVPRAVRADTSLGCVGVSSTFPEMESLAPNGPEPCSTHCSENGYTYYGLAEQFCVCASSEPTISETYDASECSFACASPYEAESCGGEDSSTFEFIYNLYSIGSAATSSAATAPSSSSSAAGLSTTSAATTPSSAPTTAASPTAASASTSTTLSSTSSSVASTHHGAMSLADSSTDAATSTSTQSRTVFVSTMDCNCTASSAATTTVATTVETTVSCSEAAVPTTLSTVVAASSFYGPYGNGTATAVGPGRLASSAAPVSSKTSATTFSSATSTASTTGSTGTVVTAGGPARPTLSKSSLYMSLAMSVLVALLM